MVNLPVVMNGEVVGKYLAVDEYNPVFAEETIIGAIVDILDQ